MKLTSILVVAVGVIGISCISHQVIARAAESRTFGKPVPLTKLKDDRIAESSGLAPSRIKDGVFFTHNDSGDSARVFAFDRGGNVLGTINFEGVTAFDCEDMATAVLDGRSRIFLGDIGDNALKRKSIYLYRVDEPAKVSGEMKLKPEVIELTYPDGAHNAETLLVHPSTGEITIVTKTSKGASGVYAVKNAYRAGRYTLKKVGSVEVSSFLNEAKLFTGGAMSPDGRYVALRTYLQAYEYAVPANGEWWKSKPTSIRTVLEFQGEAVTYSLRGDRLLTSTEGKPCAIGEIPIKN